MQTMSTGITSFLANLSQSPKDALPTDVGFTFTQPLGPKVSNWENPGVSNWVNNPRGNRDYDTEETLMPPTLSAGASLLLAALQTPCCIEKLSQPRTQVSGQFVQSSDYVAQTQPLPIIYNRDKTLYDEKQSKASYEHYRMSSDLITDTGWRAFPLGKQCTTGSSSENGDTVAFSHMHCPVQIRKVTVEAMRINAWPELIKPIHWQDEKVTPPIKHILKHYTIEPLPVQLSADGCDTIHEVVATYWYYLSRPYEVGSQYKMPVGRLPYVSKARLATQIQHSDPGTDGDKRAIGQSFFLDPKELLETVQ